MVDVAQLVRASGCGPEGRGFEPHHPPHLTLIRIYVNISNVLTNLKCDGKSPGESVAEAIKDPRIRILSLIESLKELMFVKFTHSFVVFGQSFEDSLEPYGWVNAVNLLMYDIRERRKLFLNLKGSCLAKEQTPLDMVWIEQCLKLI